MTPEPSKEKVMPETTLPEPKAVEPGVPVEEQTEGPTTDASKTAFIVLLGIVLLSGVLIYSTSVKRTDPETVLQADANGQPVQPLNPATGLEEEKLASLPPDTIIANSNTAVGATTLPGGDNYDPWAKGGTPPAGAPAIGPGGQYVTVPNGGSQFMPPDCILQPSGIYLCPVPVNANAAVKPSPTPKVMPQNANVQPSASPSGNNTKATPTPAVAKPSASPRTKPAPTPNKPAANKPADQDN